MEITLDRLKIIIGDQACQINILQTEKNQLMQSYQKLVEENEALKIKITDMEHGPFPETSRAT